MRLRSGLIPLPAAADARFASVLAWTRGSAERECTSRSPFRARILFTWERKLRARLDTLSLGAFVHGVDSPTAPRLQY
jgi:hypothetical protein